MELHKNARTCPSNRALIVKRVLKLNRHPREVAAAQGCSERTVYKWLARFKSEGWRGLQDRSSRPHSCPTRTSESRIEQILTLRRRRMVAEEIAVRLHLPRSTVARILRQAGLGRLDLLNPPQPARRYEYEHPGELLHLDIKKLGRIQGIGHRISGDRRHRPGAGWEFVHVCVDDASRLSYVEVLPDERKQSAVAFLKRAVAFYKAINITVQAILTDNGSCYRSRSFQRACRSLQLKHRFTRPYRPQTNGKAERFIQTLLREWAYRFPFHCSQMRIDWMSRYLHFYNYHRMHQALGGLAPISRIPVNNVVRLHN